MIKQVNEVFESFVVSQPEIQEYNDQIKTEQDFNTLNKLLEKHLLELVIPQMEDHIEIFPKSLQKYVINSYIDGIWQKVKEEQDVNDFPNNINDDFIDHTLTMILAKNVDLSSETTSDKPKEKQIFHPWDAKILCDDLKLIYKMLKLFLYCQGQKFLLNNEKMRYELKKSYKKISQTVLYYVAGADQEKCDDIYTKFRK